jgi:hypothetical protein
MPKNFSNQPNYPIGLRNNNPGNLRPGDSWQGMTGTNGGFIVFSDISWGLRALGTDLSNKVFRGLDTITKIIEMYAPRSENNTDAYISAVSNSTGIGKNEKLMLNGEVLKKLMRAVIMHENGAPYATLITDQDIEEGIGKMSTNILLKLKSFL